MPATKEVYGEHGAGGRGGAVQVRHLTPGDNPCAHAGSGALRLLAPSGPDNRVRGKVTSMFPGPPSPPHLKAEEPDAQLVAAKCASVATGVKRTLSDGRLLKESKA